MQIHTAVRLTQLLFVSLLISSQGIGDSSLNSDRFTAFPQLLSEEQQRAEDHRGSGRFDSTTPASVRAEPNYLARRGSGRVDPRLV